MKQIPILAIVKQSLAMPFSRPLEIFKALGLFAAAFLFMSLLIAVAMIVSGDPALFQELGQGGGEPTEATIEGMAELMLGLAPALLLGLAVMLMVAAHVFNFWVRAGAFGVENAKFETFGKALSAAGINALKFFALSLLLGVASFVAFFVLQALGLSVGFAKQMELAMSNDIAAATKAGLMNQIVMTVVTCGIYSWVSANLTQTAVGEDREGLQHPHVMDFGIVLFLLYVIVLVPQVLLSLTGNPLLMTVVYWPMLLFITLAIGVAHGIRYRICMAENEQKVFE
ncbi:MULTISPECIES: hypothetical protein [Kordiimonas]|uniref:Membrane domain of glycerophosphoryl diester phosphodiesterase n=2 Tax=Kordiimonas lacus TaxID=637679 RepID=A0A1G6VR14_9PROT|nr:MULTISPECIES: hypothetical protein [Kordiimonas]SDD55437.1 hypothetical protein SAMN04488071_0808 [Kordiimonas lacus]